SLDYSSKCPSAVRRKTPKKGSPISKKNLASLSLMCTSASRSPDLYKECVKEQLATSCTHCMT
ncbi:unnamed protein product, partial [Nesidiocoris tenuis]